MIDLDRRSFLTSAIASLGLAATARGDRLAAFAQGAAPAKPHRIDMHHHFAPPAWVAVVKGRPLLQTANTTCTPAKSIEDMDRGRYRTIRPVLACSPQCPSPTSMAR